MRNSYGKKDRDCLFILPSLGAGCRQESPGTAVLQIGGKLEKDQWFNGPGRVRPLRSSAREPLQSV